MHSITTTLSQWSQKDDGEDDIEKKEEQLWKKHDGLVWHGERHGVVGDWQDAKWMHD